MLAVTLFPTPKHCLTGERYIQAVVHVIILLDYVSVLAVQSLTPLSCALQRSAFVGPLALCNGYKLTPLICTMINSDFVELVAKVVPSGVHHGRPDGSMA